MRQFAIIHDGESTRYLFNLIKDFQNYGIKDSIYIFTEENYEIDKFRDDIDMNDIDMSNIVNVVFPKDITTPSQEKNYVNLFFKSVLKTTGFLHVIESNIKLLKNPNDFLNNIEKMMELLDYDSWFNTIGDKCNFLYNKFNPRLFLDLPENNVFNTKTLMITTNCNTQWTIFNLDKCSDSDILFDDRFHIPMFYIIDFLARRRQSKKENSLYFMNSYFTIYDELGLFNVLDKPITTEKYQEQKKFISERMKKEDIIFKEKKLNIIPNNNIDIILEKIYEKIKTKEK